MTKTVSLDDKYQQLAGSVFLSSIQVLVRLPIDQGRRDRAAGLSTAGFISGYRGSPIGTFDAALWGQQQLLAEHNIRFLPGLNEELAATAVRGTQELAWFGKAKVNGVFSIWYGKGLGADRAAEALKLGNLEGAAAKGGVLVVVGDDHGGKSSVSSHQSEQVLIAGMLPILYPATTADILEFGLFGWALSRFSGLYVAMKCVTDTLDLSSTIVLPDLHRAYAVPTDLVQPAGGLNLRPAMAQLFQEDLTVNSRLPAAQAFARANGIDKIVVDTTRPVLTLVSAGKAYLDLRQALFDLGLSESKCADLGIRVYKPGMIWPLDHIGAKRAAAGAQEVLVVEEKRPVIEDQMAVALFGAAERPTLLGKRDADGSSLLPSYGELNPSIVRDVVMRRLRARGLADADTEKRFAYFEQLKSRAAQIGGSSLMRPAFFCSGCPHNTSTKVPLGSQAMGATGCHAMPAYMPNSVTMRPVTMGAEGLPWLGVEHLVDMPHVFQNMGDGTYAHSGLLAIRAAVAAGATMTYKILYNDAVAMTGGQPVEGSPSPYTIVNQLLAEWVNPVVVVYDPAEKIDSGLLPAGVESYPRSELDRVQRQLREVKGVSAIVYVQTCAAEKRRRRKRGKFPDPDLRVFINPEVCEGCGDCSVQSNCISVQPLETKLGRKRIIDQSSCNKDFSCLKGFCPSFVTVTGSKMLPAPVANTSLDSELSSLPAATVVRREQGSYNVLVTGIGGTGVLTVGAILGMAAHIEGKACTVMDMTGLAQKGGAVTSHIRIADEPGVLTNARFDLGMSDVLIGCDLVVAAGADVLKTVNPGVTRAILNSDVASTGEFARNRDLDLSSDKLEALVRRALESIEPKVVPATRIAMKFLGDSIATNLFMLGCAAQAGYLPVSVTSLEQAIALNGVSVKLNQRAFALGRLAAVATAKLLDDPAPAAAVAPGSVEDIVRDRTALLTSYQNEAYARCYADFIAATGRRVAARKLADGEAFLREVALSLAQVMAYKDEYEVARLHADPQFWKSLRDKYGQDIRPMFHLAPPLFSRIDPATGRPRKQAYGAWMAQGFALLQHFKFLRGSVLDPFGYLHERRLERGRIEEYRQLIDSIADRLDAGNIATGIAMAAAIREVRGYGPVKDAAAQAYAKRLDTLRTEFQQTPDRERPAHVRMTA
jgi:indolepyruvate ferredoxin oxidoreductase